ncbi:hypothetical protein ASPCADRAFT_209312 [Aspergillus carbonarius ITEM 5010]|uniref:Uncharacterized protein n=1 Tax=Aspergillus carbonarius (strain ITEM 5010) TaxID=602072 RepID=A0A1R3RFY1_ASPC5|nr:hypothetical protein ASPCADRAFT_209312 [Aspergillus carbonarius ITEM 5010]
MYGRVANQGSRSGRPPSIHQSSAAAAVIRRRVNFPRSQAMRIKRALPGIGFRASPP